MGNKIYSPDNCLFVSQQVNKLFTANLASKGKYPTGVSYDKGRNKFMASCRSNGKANNLGRFVSLADAVSAYVSFKKEEIIRVSGLQSNNLVRLALLRRAEEFTVYG